MKKIKLINKNIKKNVMIVVSFLTITIAAMNNSVHAAYVGSFNYRKINEQIMNNYAIHGVTKTQYNNLKKQINTLNGFEKDALNLKLDTVVQKHGGYVRNNNTQKPTDTTNTQNKKYKHPILINGDDTGKIRPNALITREEAATIVARNLNPKDKKTYNHKFTDVKKTSWSYKYINQLNVSGYKDGTFKPKNRINRAEALALVHKSLNGKTPASKPISKNIYFKDIKGHWAEDLIIEMAQAGVVNGRPNNYFMPDEYITRAEFIVMLNKATRNCTLNKSSVLYKDTFKLYKKELQNHWAVDFLIEALVPHS